MLVISFSVMTNWTLLFYVRLIYMYMYLYSSEKHDSNQANKTKEK